MRFTIRGCVARAALLLLLAAPVAAAAALTCEQLLATAEAAVHFRDQGHSLERVLTGLKGIDETYQFAPAELEVLRNAVSMAFLSQASPEELALECVEARGGKKP